MFEFDQQIVNSLLSQDRDFERLYNKHASLKQRVVEANTGVDPVDELTLEQLKKQKLLVKDRLASIIEDYRRVHA